MPLEWSSILLACFRFGGTDAAGGVTDPAGVGGTDADGRVFASRKGDVAVNQELAGVTDFLLRGTRGAECVDRAAGW